MKPELQHFIVSDFVSLTTEANIVSFMSAENSNSYNNKQ